MDERTEYVLSAEIHRARRKFPSNNHLLAALMEEVGELAQALLEYEHGEGGRRGADVYREAIQVACVAIRIAEEGDGGFAYEFNHRYYQEFPVEPVMSGASQ